MTAKQSDQYLLERLKALEEENARLRAVNSNGKARLIVTEGEYKGFTTLIFDGSVRLFTLGLTKLRALKECLLASRSFFSAIRKQQMMTISKSEPRSPFKYLGSFS